MIKQYIRPPILFLVRKRIVAARQHRRESMPTVGGDDEAETEAEA